MWTFSKRFKNNTKEKSSSLPQKNRVRKSDYHLASSKSSPRNEKQRRMSLTPNSKVSCRDKYTKKSFDDKKRCTSSRFETKESEAENNCKRKSESDQEVGVRKRRSKFQPEKLQNIDKNLPSTRKHQGENFEDELK